jgi:hypothetical protein
MTDSTLSTLSTFPSWDTAMTFAIRKANLLGVLVGIRYNEVFKYFTLSLLQRHERHERQWVSVVAPGDPHSYRGDFIGPWERSAPRKEN